jgi:hypothetical protein
MRSEWGKSMDRGGNDAIGGSMLEDFPCWKIFSR